MHFFYSNNKIIVLRNTGHALMINQNNFKSVQYFHYFKMFFFGVINNIIVQQKSVILLFFGSEESENPFNLQ